MQTSATAVSRLAIPGQRSFGCQSANAPLRSGNRCAALAAALVTCLAGQVDQALAYACNNNYYVNSSGHLVHSPSCGEEHQKRTAECRDGSVSYSEHHRGTCSYHGGVAHWD
jgi:predicted RNA-binding Zn-ribbon protein involved in translation (DUF1610 family)